MNQYELKPIVVQTLKDRAKRGVFDGTSTTKNYLNRCRARHEQSGTSIVFTRDIGYHSSGWFKNPFYESLRYSGSRTG